MYDRTTSTTVSAACRHLVLPFKSAPHWRWLCGAAKLEPVYNALTGHSDKFPPYAWCKNINGGDCPRYEPGPNELKPRATPEGEIL